MSDDMSSKNEADAPLTGAVSIIHNDQKCTIHDTQIVITLYGKNKHITHASVHLFDETDRMREDNPAGEYCNKINNLVFAGDDWIHAEIVKENEITELKEPININVFLDMDDHAVQKVIREVDTPTLALAFQNVDKGILEKVLKNVSKRVAAMLKEDMEYIGQVRLSDITKAQQKVISIIRHFENTGEIIISQ
jgi:hypothetical protein